MASGARAHKRARPSLARKAETSAAREEMFPPDCRALVMVSGGQDSLALLHLLATGSFRRAAPASFRALHINHHLRGPESDADEALVVRSCAEMRVPLTVLHRPIEKHDGDVQQAARDARRSAAITVAAEFGCDRIAVGHTADDQAETVLYRLGRYGGLASFSSMKACDPPWVRPLLGCRRKETELYCRYHGLEFANDRGNAYPGYARTAIREQVLPAWEAALPGAVEAVCRAAEVAAEMREVVLTALDREMPGLDEAEELEVGRLLGMTPAVRRALLHAWLEGRARSAASRAGVLAVESLLSTTGSAERSLGGGWRACKEYDRLTVRHGFGAQTCAPPGTSPDQVALPLPGEVVWGGQVVRAEVLREYSLPVLDVAREALLDAGSIGGPLSVRGPRAGDRLRPLGAPGVRKLQDVLVDLHVPARRRPLVPLVVCGDRIVWVGGLVLAEEGRISSKTTAVVRLRLDRRLG